jgi:hypothetical protein
VRDEVERILREFFGNKPIPSATDEAIKNGCPRINHDDWLEAACKK